MKKKLLSLVLAGAMVATTSVSAFAEANVTGLDTQDAKTNVSITGKVLDDDKHEPAGTFKVSIPTTASFTVDKDHKVISADITVRNEGDQDIDVFAESFVDITPGADQKITVVPERDLKSKNRTNVTLSLEGEFRTLYLKSEASETGGIYTDSNLATPANNDTNKKLSNVQSGQTKTISLRGKAGESDTENPVTESVSDKFTLTLKIRKAIK